MKRQEMIRVTSGLAHVLAAGALALAGCAGADGEQGPAGPAGPTGPAGAAGERGPVGTDGADGANGVSGMDGADGADGMDGMDGARGPGASITLREIGRYDSGVFDESAAEIVAHDPGSQRLFVVNANSGKLDVLSITDPTAPTLDQVLDIQQDVTAEGSITTTLGAANSVDVSGGQVAVAVAADATADKGVVAIYDAATLTLTSVFEVGVLPDSVAFTPNGEKLVVANEGEPDDDYLVDPPGSISILTLTEPSAVVDLDFTEFDPGGPRAGELDADVRVFGGANPLPSTDLEPEYVAISPDGERAFVSLQEANAIAVVDLTSDTIQSIFSMGFKDHSLLGNELDPSNRDGGIRIANWPIQGMYQPDAIKSYVFQGQRLIVTANEGDARDYDGFSEESRLADVLLDPLAFPDAATLQDEANLGRLNVTTALGDTDGDDDLDVIYAYGARSFSIYTESGEQLFDSGNDFEVRLAQRLGEDFNSTNDENGSGDARSDDKGPEPEAVALGMVDQTMFAFIGLERVGGVMVYDISNPQSPRFVEYQPSRNFSVPATVEVGGMTMSNPEAGNLGPEDIIFIPADQSPLTDTPLLVVSSEVSGTTQIFSVQAL